MQLVGAAYLLYLIRDWDSGGILPPVSFAPDNYHAQRAGIVCELREGRFVARTGWGDPQMHYTVVHGPQD